MTDWSYQHTEAFTVNALHHFLACGLCYTAVVLDALDQLLQAPDRTPLPAGLGPLRPLAERLLAAPDPRDCLLNLRRLAEAAPDAPWPQQGKALAATAAVLTSGPEMGRVLARDPGRLAYLNDPTLGRAWTRGELQRELEHRLDEVTDEQGLALGLTRFRDDHFVRLAACEFTDVPLEQVGRELSMLADLCVDGALSFCLDRLARDHGPPQTADGEPVGLAVIAMGKYGARELNFCSDIDVIFVYDTDEGAAGDLSLHELFSRACQQVTRVLSERNAEGFCFRVDLGLRPEGNRGPICNSLAGAERFYETWGGPWDRLAWLKSRAAAGDLALGQEMVDLLHPFVFPRSIRPEIVDHIQELNRRIKAQPRGSGWNVKLHAGGIREVEFFVQSLQLLHAGKQPALQEPSTLGALDRLLFAGLISEQEHRQLAEAYELWRRIEHRLQLREGRQTHVLPDRGAPLFSRVAGHMGMTDDQLADQVRARRRTVEQIYATLGVDPQPEHALAPLLDPELPREQAEQILGEAGFTQAERAAEHLALLASKAWGPLGRSPAPSVAALALPLLSEVARSPDPDAALQHLTELSLRFGPYRGLWELLAHNRETLRLLLSLFGTSDYLARIFKDHPELLDRLLLTGHARRQMTAGQLRQHLQSRLAPLEPDDTEARLRALGRFRNEEVLRVGLHDIAGTLGQQQVWAQLSDLADVLLQELFGMVLDDTRRRYGTPRREDGGEAPLAVLGLGKLGSRELTYASDLDLVFVYSGAGETDGERQVDNAEFYARAAQRLIRALSTDMGEGRLYEVDTRLRPSGNQGTLVCSEEAFKDYHASSRIWERQVLIKARAVAGDPERGRSLVRWTATFVYDSPLDPAQAKAEIHHHRARMEQELARESADFHDLKLGRGGLLDIDFVVQYLQLRHGGDAAVRARSTLGALRALQRGGHLDRQTARTLEASYRFLRRLESRLRMVRDRSAARLPASAAGLEVMARRLGYREQPGTGTPGAQLLDEYRRQTETVRRIYEEHLA